MLYDYEFFMELAVSSLSQDDAKYALYMWHHNNIEIYELNDSAES